METQEHECDCDDYFGEREGEPRDDELDDVIEFLRQRGVDAMRCGGEAPALLDELIGRLERGEHRT